VLRAGSVAVAAIGLMGWALTSASTQLGQPRTATGAYWGVDSVATTPARLASVQRDYVATPAFWGRYLSDCTNRCGGNLTPAEAHQDIAGGIRLLLVAADAGGRADRGRAYGTTDGRRAVAAARALGVPRGVALFKDLENDSPVNASFIAAWYGAVSAGGYEPGFYLNALPGEEGGAAYCRAVRADPAVGSSYLWASESERDAWASTPPGRAPAFSGARFQAVFPACSGRDAVWQYSESDNGGVDEDESLTVAPLWI
jgi:hypothetical protein